MDYRKAAEEILKNIGGKDNIESVTHCATRLRMVLKDEGKADAKAIEKLDLVEGSFSNAGQFQIILGQGKVNKVYKELSEIAGIKESSTSDVKKAAMKNLNPLQRFARILSNIFVPIIPAIVASGLLMGLLGMSATFGWIEGDSGLFVLLDMFSNAAFVFLPVLIAFSAAREFGANPFLAAALGGIMIHPALQNAWTLGGGVENTISLFGFEVGMVGYQGTVLPVMIAVWIMSYIEKFFRKIVPNILDIILTPFLTLMTTAFLSLIVIGPAGRFLGDIISYGLQGVYSTAGFLAGLVFGGLYSTIVITGIHHSFHAIEAGLLANPSIGVNFLLPIWAMANVAQGGAATAVYFKTKNQKIKQVALPAATSCLLGITEAAIFGVNLRLRKPFVAAALGGALGGAYVVFMNVAMTAVGVTGIPGIAIVQQQSMIHYIIGILLAFGGAFAFVNVLGFEDEPEEIEDFVDSDETEEIVLTESEVVISAPVDGRLLKIEEVPDKTFADKILGDGFAIEPSNGKVFSPVDGKILMAFETGHALAVGSENGGEILVHFGIDTVKLNGEGFKLLVKKGDVVKKGDPVLEVDLEAINKNAPSSITPVVITNSKDFDITLIKEGGMIKVGEDIIKLTAREAKNE
ncbi:sucrose-specific PTS transporter subunit IIBC [Alkalibacter saccharofermentans]|uniref:PTS system, sucrose-specific IIC component n=1 Tax=Alkalibacter saccharofermentans DSM 14828 TaxID=1120975 RepID=A0A1M4SJK6_9FIRM|nr:sucrose-specific PTS transporter subunit IIBC [Alkalibacter saccharofermentans]SHE32423.1 PTS system, sucrose-specific IIC component [Alkalibacter saccharofermentans DSM 14828]